MRGEFFLEALSDVNDKYIEEARKKTMKKRFGLKPLIAVAACAALVAAILPAAMHFSGGFDSTANTTVTTGQQTPGQQTPGQQTPIKKEYTALIYDYTDGGVGGKKDIDLSDKTIIKDSTPHAIAMVNGKSFIGTYEGTRIGSGYNDERDSYTYDNGSVYGRYMINNKTNEVCYFSIYYTNDKASNYDGREIYTEAECLEMAKNFMKQYTPNIDEYTIISHYTKTHKAYGTYYTYKFREYIGDIGIGNTASVDINMYGDIIYFAYDTDIEDVEAFKASGYIESIDWDAADEAIGKRACEAYTSRDDFYEYFELCHYVSGGKYETTKTLAKMSDGRYALYCTAYVRLCYNANNTKDGPINDVLLLVYLD